MVILKKKSCSQFVKLNKNLFLENAQIETFKELCYILNKIEINLHIQNEIKKLTYKDFNNQKYIDILKNKHSIFFNNGLKKWPILSIIRIIKKYIKPVSSQ